jgi:type II secretory pathway component GspD/PulD (secretin)
VAADGKISAIGGLIREKTGERDAGVPGLMDAPLIGPFFKTHFEEQQRHELLVLIRPFVLLAPGESEPVSRDLFQRLSEHPCARDDIPAMKIGKGNFLLVNEKLYHVPYQALKAISRNAAVWSTE